MWVCEKATKGKLYNSNINVELFFAEHFHIHLWFFLHIYLFPLSLWLAFSPNVLCACFKSNRWEELLFYGRTKMIICNEYHLNINHTNYISPVKSVENLLFCSNVHTDHKMIAVRQHDEIKLHYTKSLIRGIKSNILKYGFLRWYIRTVGIHSPNIFWIKFFANFIPLFLAWTLLYLLTILIMSWYVNLNSE